MFRSVLIAGTVLLAGSVAGCVQYRALSTSPARQAATLPDAPVGALDFQSAVALLVDRHPELIALRMDADAVNLDPHPVPLTAEARLVDGAAGNTWLAAEMLSILGIGPRPAARWWARAVRKERWLRHHERARELVGELAEAFAVHAALDGIPASIEAPDVAPFDEAGLLSDAVRTAAEAVTRQTQAEAAHWQLARERARLRIAALTGARAQATPEPVAMDASWPHVAEPQARDLLLARGDLLRLWGAFAVADRAFRLAVAKQMPDVVLRLGGNIDLETPLQILTVRLPLEAPREAAAAACARHAAAARVRAGVHSALEESAIAQSDHAVAMAGLDAARAEQDAAGALVIAERARLETNADALAAWVRATQRRVQALHRLRQAVQAEARARVNAARAAGWPTCAQIGGAR